VSELCSRLVRKMGSLWETPGWGFFIGLIVAPLSGVPEMWGLAAFLTTICWIIDPSRCCQDLSRVFS
jgi:hypothetical protein